VDEAILEEMERRVREEPEKMKKRKELVEHPFGTMKKGMKKAAAEMSLTVLSGFVA
jgi:hypothetical protein